MASIHSQKASSGDLIDRFLKERDLSLLAHQPIVFDKDEAASASYEQCWGCTVCWLTGGLTGLIWPVWTCCAGKLTSGVTLELNHENLTFVYKMNDICCSVSTTRRVIPLEQIKSVTVEDGCFLNMKGVKLLKVEDGQTRITIADDGCYSSSAVECTFVKDAEKAHEVIMLATRLVKQGGGAPAVQAAMR